MRDLTREQLLEELRALRPELERAGVTRLALFGSRARNDHRQDSDIDLLVDYDRNRKFSLLDLIGAMNVVEDNVGLQANMVVEEDADPAFLTRISRDQVTIY